MSQDLPSLDDIVRTAREFIHSAASRLPRDLTYDAQVAVYLLQIAEREIIHRTELDESDACVLNELLGTSGTNAELVRMLCREIRAGQRDADWDRTLEAVLKLTVSKVSIVRPDRLDAMHSGAVVTTINE